MQFLCEETLRDPDGKLNTGLSSGREIGGRKAVRPTPSELGVWAGRLPKTNGYFFNLNIPAVVCLGYFFLIIFFPLSANLVFSEELKPQAPKNEEAKEKEPAPEFMGEFFDAQVPAQNYYFVKSAVIVFGNRWGAAPRTLEEQEGCIWDQLLLSFEAFRRNITVSQEEVDQEITKTLQEYKVDFDWKNNPEAYKKWVEEKSGESAELFGNQIRHLLQIEKLRQQVMDSINLEVTDQEAHQTFLDEHNSLSVEVVQFDAQKQAEEFYQKVRRGQKFWEKEKANKPDVFKRPGFVSLIFLMELWKFPREAVYKMMRMKQGSVHPPAPIYKGYGVFLVLEKRLADELRYVKEKNSYDEKVRGRKKYEGLNVWFKGLKEQAKITIYEKKREEEK